MAYRKWHPVVVCAICAPLLAAGATYWVHQHVDRWEIPWLPVFDDLGCPLCTCYLNTSFGLPDSEPDFEVPDSYRVQFPEWDRFLRGIEKQIKQRSPKDGKLFEVWIAPLGLYNHAPHGWPFISRDRAFVVEMDWHSPDGSHFEQIYLGQDGAAPERPVGMLCNWVFYFALSLPLVWLSDFAIRRGIRWMSRRRHGFPVIMLDEPR